ncbi:MULTISPECIES: fumarate hydratase [Pedobacter]|uniref:fumarate hydratase n=1 Tax=Pedobacter TaxID=84567 RepID=UPI00210888AF|nr:MULTISPECIES: fumarate hydratase [unclassified Pedobacter]
MFVSRTGVLLVGVALYGLTGSCTRLPDVQGNGEAFLQGKWDQDSAKVTGERLNYSLHKFSFTCDSFYLDLTTYSKVNYYADSCFNSGVWQEYAKGTYVVRGDTLLLAGVYTKANYKQKISGCYNSGQYIRSFKILSKSDSTLDLESTDNQKIVSMNLKERKACVPQPL